MKARWLDIISDPDYSSWKVALQHNRAKMRSRLSDHCDVLTINLKWHSLADIDTTMGNRAALLLFHIIFHNLRRSPLDLLRLKLQGKSWEVGYQYWGTFTDHQTGLSSLCVARFIVIVLDNFPNSTL